MLKSAGLAYCIRMEACVVVNCVLYFQFVSIAGFFVNLIGIMSFRHSHSHHGHSHTAAVMHSHATPSSHTSHAHSAACSAHCHAEHSHTASPPSSAVTHNTNMEGFTIFVCTLLACSAFVMQWLHLK